MKYEMKILISFLFKAIYFTPKSGTTGADPDWNPFKRSWSHTVLNSGKSKEKSAKGKGSTNKDKQNGADTSKNAKSSAESSSVDSHEAKQPKATREADKNKDAIENLHDFDLPIDLVDI